MQNEYIEMHATSDVSGQAQSPELDPARPEAGLGSGFQWAWAWLKVQKPQSLGLITMQEIVFK